MTTDEPQRDTVTPVDLPRLVARAQGQRIAWTASSDDLNVNLIVLNQDEHIDEHRNDEVDVLIVGIEGTGEVSVDGVTNRITPDTAILVPRGSTRSLRSLGPPFAYLTCHRQRKQLWPGAPSRRSSESDSESS